MSRNKPFTSLFIAMAMLCALPAWAEEGPKLPDAEEVVYRVNLGRADDVKLLIDQGASPNSTNRDGVPLLSLAAARTDREGLNVVKTLLTAGAEVDNKDPTGRTPLFYAAKQGNKKVVLFLLEHDANYYLTDKEGNVARNLAHNAGHADIVEAMDDFVKNLTEQRRKQYDNYNQTIQDRLKEKEEPEPQPTPTPPPVTEPKIEPTVEPATPITEKPVAPPQKPVNEAAKAKAEYQLVYHSCAFQYWSFCYATKQSTELSPEELSVAINTHQEKTLDAIHELIDEHRVKRKLASAISLRAKQHIFNRLTLMPSKTYRHEHGVGKLEDMKTRCEMISRHWEENPPPLPGGNRKSRR